jgi:hypothetical protein
MLYNALIYPYLIYGVLLWGSTYQVHLNKIVVMQKRAVRSIVRAPFNSHTDNIFSRLNLLKFTDIYQLYLGMHMYSQINNLLPSPLQRNLRFCDDIHSHFTRQTNQLHTEGIQSAIVANSFVKMGPDYWNALPDDIKHSATIKSFNSKHKLYLLNKFII